jgi:hypothetical protein
MLRTSRLGSGPRCSKAPRGLFVLSWGTRIFTGTSISPSPLSRQCSSRYSLRAGRNLPDKEFRYLRTVIVTAAVHRGFAWWLRTPRRLTFRHWAGVSPYMSTFVFAETCVFGKQSLEPVSCDPLASLLWGERLLGHPFFRRYGVNLPSSLTEVRSFTWGEFPRPTGVGLRYGHTHNWLAAFLGGLGLGNFRPLAQARDRRHGVGSGFASIPHFVRPAPPVHLRGFPSLPRPRFARSAAVWCRTIRPACHRLRL